MTSNVVAKNSLMRGKFTRMVLWMPSFISFFEMPSIMNLASLLAVNCTSVIFAVKGFLLDRIQVAHPLT